MGERARLRIQVSGAVQGVGFRPFVYRLARSLGLGGWVRNTPAGVRIEAEGDPAALRDLLLRLRRERPAAARIRRVAHRRMPLRAAAAGGPALPADFEIRQSRRRGPAAALITPDLATCADCLRELLDPKDRRHRYPFLNCTRCGPRYSIIESLPYDRPRTTLRAFRMCPCCQAEYDDPRDRRFHAQPTACPACGPALALWGPGGERRAAGDAALGLAAEALRAGAVVAIKGLGGFHLFVDACDEQAVRRLRRRKARPDKPLALMCPDLGQVRARCRVTRAEARLLRGRAAPIVLLSLRAGPGATPDDIAPAVAPGPHSRLLGVMLPYTPLHHLLLRDLGRPLVATSGNRAGEPLCIDERQALERLAGIADLFLVHDRPIARPVDDSVARVVAGRPLICRRARGYAPLPVALPEGAALPEGVSVLGLGAQQKGAVALARGGEVLLGQHLGDLDTPEAMDACRQSAATLVALCARKGHPPGEVASDLHPDHASTRIARELAREHGARLVAVQHHHAHALACLLDNGEAPPALAVVWDGAGLGTDGTIWGGEFLLVQGSTFTRFGHLRTFPLPGGDAAAREPRRAALGALYEIHGDALFAAHRRPPLSACFSESELRVLRQALRAGVSCPRTSSAGRLFDALAALLGLAPRTSFEAQAAMALEDAGAGAAGLGEDEGYPFSLEGGAAPGAVVVDWAPLLHAAQEDLARGVALPRIAARCHRTLCEMIVAVAARAGQARVALCGGCFQNRLLLERTVRRLREAGLQPLWPRRVPPGDNGVALGQVCCAALRAAGR